MCSQLTLSLPSQISGTCLSTIKMDFQLNFFKSLLWSPADAVMSWAAINRDVPSANNVTFDLKHLMYQWYRFKTIVDEE